MQSIKPYWECHITLSGTAEVLRPLVEGLKPRWSFSAIENDIILGPGTKCYATRHFNHTKLDAEAVKLRLSQAAKSLTAQGAKVIREKVELVIWDKRTKAKAAKPAAESRPYVDFKLILNNDAKVICGTFWGPMAAPDFQLVFKTPSRIHPRTRNALADLVYHGVLSVLVSKTQGVTFKQVSGRASAIGQHISKAFIAKYGKFPITIN